MPKSIAEFVENFDSDNPDWNSLPDDFPNTDLEGLTSSQVGKFNAIKGLWELNRPQPIKQQSRVWTDPKGYQYLAAWQNSALLRVLIRKFTNTLPLDSTLKQPLEYRRKAQMDDAARSVKRNIEEGWKRPTTSEDLQFLGYSQASLEEVRGDTRDAKQDGFLKSRPGSSLLDIGIDLSIFKSPRKVYGEPTEPSHPYYKPLKTLKGKELTYEIFMELINKTDWLLRRLVESLERKLEQDKKGYQIDQARIRDRLRI